MAIAVPTVNHCSPRRKLAANGRAQNSREYKGQVQTIGELSWCLELQLCTPVPPLGIRVLNQDYRRTIRGQDHHTRAQSRLGAPAGNIKTETSNWTEVRIDSDKADLLTTFSLTPEKAKSQLDSSDRKSNTCPSSWKKGNLDESWKPRKKTCYLSHWRTAFRISYS